jgi:hypothetical protein
MALTPGFKKFIGLVATVAIVGGSIAAYKAGMFKTDPSKQVAQQQTEEQSPQPLSSPIYQAETLKKIVGMDTPKQPDIQPEAPQEAPLVHHSDSSSDRGMSALLGNSK